MISNALTPRLEEGEIVVRVRFNIPPRAAYEKFDFAQAAIWMTAVVQRGSPYLRQSADVERQFLEALDYSVRQLQTQVNDAKRLPSVETRLSKCDPNYSFVSGRQLRPPKVNWSVTPVQQSPSSSPASCADPRSPVADDPRQAARDYDAVQTLYSSARDCPSARRAVEQMKLHLESKRIVPNNAQYSIRYPDQKPSPTISDLAVDRTMRIGIDHSRCFNQ